jgi:hypothetical protein
MKERRFTSMAQQRRFEAQQREIEKIRNEKTKAKDNDDNQGRQDSSRPSGEHPSGA